MFLFSWDWELWRLSRLLASLLHPLRNASLLVALVFTAVEAGQPEAWTLFLGELLFNLVALLVVTWLIGEVGVALAVAIDEWRRVLAPGSNSIPESLRDATTSGHPRSHSGIESTRPHDADGARSGRGEQQRTKDAEAPDTRYEGSPGALTRRKDTAMHYTRIRSLVERLRGPRAIALLAMCAVLIATSGAFAIVQLRSQRGEAAGLQALTLPGQQRWMQAGTPVSSYLFGTTDLGQEGVSPNIETSPAAQQLLKSAGVTVIRTDFPDNASDAVINLRLQTIANAGAACLGTITNPANVAFDVHLVKLATQRGCSMFEVGLSPDAAGVPVATYLAQWKALVPQLRAATSPLTLTLIGPATQAENHAYIDAFLQGAKAANTLPDALSYHWFPCAQLAQDACLAQAPNVTQTVQDAQALMQQDLGTALPIAITAWNAQLSGTPSAYVSDPAFIAPFTAVALTAMGQDGVALAAQVAAASGAGGGALDMIGVHPVQPRAQLIAMMAMVQADRLPCGTPVPTMSPTTGTGTPGVTATAGTLTPGTTATPTAGTTPTATGTLTPTTTTATTPSATVGVTPTMTVTPCPPCPTPQLPMTPTSTSTMPASPTVPVIGTATPTQAAPSATASMTQTPVTGTPTPSPCLPTPCPSPQATPIGTGVPTITPTGTTGILSPTATASSTAITPTPGGTPCPTGSGTVAWSPFVAGGLVFVQGNLAIHALTPTTGQGVWSSAQASSGGTIGTLHWQSPILVNGQLIVVDNSGQLTAYALPLHEWKAKSS